MQPMGTLLAIDGLHILRRVYEASPEADTPEKAEIAVRNAAASFRRLLETQTPTHVLPAFDAGGLNWRHAIHPAYRQQHKPLPHVLAERLPDLHHALERLGLHPVAVQGVETDDVIATAVLRWMQEQRGEAVVAGADRKLHFLIARGARIWDHFKGEWHDREWVEQRFGVPPEKLADLLALVGNPADGVPGIPKIGQKTAARLLAACDDLEGVMAGPGVLLDPLGQRLRAGREAAFLSRSLLELKTDVRLGVSWNMLRRH